MNHKHWLAGCVALALSGAANASLVVGWSYTYSGAGAALGSGTFTAELADAAIVESYRYSGTYDADRPQDFYVLTSASGTINGNAVTSVVATDPGFNGNDNLLILPGSPNALAYGAVSYNGVSFGDAGGNSWNLFLYEVLADAPYFTYNISSVQGDLGASGDLTLTVESGLPVAPVPLPAAAWLLLSGLGGLSWFGRSKRQV
ncbi:MAG: hypothetical protein B7Y51_04735 [Burkholderiales bacterium 28-67-8]|nr:MAG: hypothetical protein B7Y51_04735 [Burkholderiales bacterium 28-67-8]